MCVFRFLFFSLLNLSTLARTSSIILDKMVMVGVLVSVLIFFFSFLRRNASNVSPLSMKCLVDTLHQVKKVPVKSYSLKN